MPDNDSGKSPVPQVRNLKGLLHYQTSSVVSHVLVKNQGGNVTLFAFAKGEGLSEHTAPFDALVVGIEGEAEIQISGNKYRLQEAETITMPANEPHGVTALTDFKMLLVMIRG